MTINHPFALSRATTEADMAAIVECQFKTFTEKVVREVFMGPDTAQGRSKLAKLYLEISHKDTGDIWMKVEEKATGKLVAASNWKVYPGSVPEHKEETTWEWMKDDPEKLAKAKAVLDAVIETRVRLFTEPYLQLHICFTDPDYQRRGIGAMMLKWGCGVADDLFLPAWVEASPTGNHLYKVFGFRDVEVNTGKELEGSTMKREARTTVIEGGKAA